jgi:hypothetical protein
MRTIEEAFESLTRQFGLPIEIDEYGGCQLIIDDVIVLDIEISPSGKELLFVIDLGEVLVGKYRHDLLKAALIENGKPYPRYGDLAFSPQGDTLLLSDLLIIEAYDDESLINYWELFTNKAKMWMEYITAGRVPPVGKQDRSSPFGGPGMRL